MQLRAVAAYGVLADYFVKDAGSGTGLRRVLNRARLLTPSSAPFYTGRISPGRPNVSMKCRLWPMR